MLYYRSEIGLFSLHRWNTAYLSNQSYLNSGPIRASWRMRLFLLDHFISTLSLHACMCSFTSLHQGFLAKSFPLIDAFLLAGIKVVSVHWPWISQCGSKLSHYIDCGSPSVDSLCDSAGCLELLPGLPLILEAEQLFTAAWQLDS